LQMHMQIYNNFTFSHALPRKSSCEAQRCELSTCYRIFASKARTKSQRLRLRLATLPPWCVASACA